MSTQRDKIWAATLDLIEVKRSFSAAEIQDNIEEAPAERTVRNTLNSMESLGFLTSDGGTGSASKVFSPQEAGQMPEIPGYTPQKSTQSGTFPYPGSKSHLTEWIIGTMPAHDTYVEVFGGSAGVLYSKPKSRNEIYNDLNEDLAQFFRVLRERSEELTEWLQHVPYSRAQYERWVSDFYNGGRPEDPIKRAGQFFSLRYMQFLGISNSPNSFKTRARRSPPRTFANAQKRLNALSERFEEVTIENVDYKEIFDMYDDTAEGDRAVDVLFYADPPYIGSEYHYGEEFDHEAFVNHLHNIENDWIVSYSEIPAELEEYVVLEQQSESRMKRDSNNVTERLVCNFDPEKRPSFDSSNTG